MKNIIIIKEEWSQILAVLISSLIMATSGALIAWTSPSIPILISEENILKLTLSEASYLTVIGPICLLIAAFPCSYMVDKYGRKNNLLITPILYTLSWILIAKATSKWMLYMSRLLSGLADSAVTSSISLYVGEITTPKIRGSWGNSVMLMLYIGVLMVNTIGTYCSIAMTAYYLTIIPIIFFFALILMPESPYYNIMIGKFDEAKESLQWLRRKDDVKEEFKKISDGINTQLSEPGDFKHLFVIESNRKMVLASCVARFTQQFSGVYAFTLYSQHIFQLSGGNISSSTSAIICSGVMLVTSLLASILMNKMGRRQLILISSIGCCLVLLFLSLFLFIHLETDVNLDDFLWFPTFGMILFIIFFSFGLGIVPTLLLSELFPASIKGKATAMTNAFYGFFSAASTIIFQLLLGYGLYLPFIFYAVSCGIGTIACYFLIPETKGKTLEEIQEYIKSNRKIHT